METPKWKTTALGIIAAVATVLTFFKPDWFNVDTNPVIVGAVDAIIASALTLVSIFSAKDEATIDNVG